MPRARLRRILCQRDFSSAIYIARRDTIACTRNCALVRTTLRELRLPFYVTGRRRRCRRRDTCLSLVERDKTDTSSSPAGIVRRPLFTRHHVIAPTASLITASVQRMHTNVGFSTSSKRREVRMCGILCMCVTIAVLGNGGQHHSTGYTAALFIIVFLFRRAFEGED